MLPLSQQWIETLNLKQRLGLSLCKHDGPSKACYPTQLANINACSVQGLHFWAIKGILCSLFQVEAGMHQGSTTPKVTF